MNRHFPRGGWAVLAALTHLLVIAEVGLGSALIEAAKECDLVRVRDLIDGGANPNETDREVGTPLHAAAYTGCDPLVVLLLEKGALADPKDAEGTTPLQWAATKGNVIVAAKLIEAGADLNSTDNYGATPLLLALTEEHGVVARLLVEAGADVNLRKPDGGTPLQLAAARGDRDVTELLLRHGADPNARSAASSTPLHWAAVKGRHDVVALLIDHGADIDVLDRDGATALHYAVGSQDHGLVQLLLERGANVEVKDPNGYTPLHVAAMKKDTVTMKLLLAKEADLEARTGTDGDTPLRLAASQGDLEGVKLLVAAGADVSTRRNSGMTPREMAAGHRHPHVASWLESHSVIAKGGFSETVPANCDPSLFEVQKLLREKGFYRGTPDGVPGPNTASALRAFQQSKGLVVTGQLDSATRSQLVPTDVSKAQALSMIAPGLSSLQVDMFSGEFSEGSKQISGSVKDVTSGFLVISDFGHEKRFPLTDSTLIVFCDARVGVDQLRKAEKVRVSYSAGPATVRIDNMIPTQAYQSIRTDAVEILK